MYNTRGDKLPRRPAVPSMTGAAQEFATWLRENSYASLLDGDGLSWHLKVSADQQPNPEDVKSSIWQVRCEVQADCSVAEFVKTGTLSPTTDDRLIALIGPALVPLRIRPLTHTAASQEDMRNFLAEELPKLKESLSKRSLHEVKRSLIGRWLDENRIFGTGQGHGKF